MMAANLRTTPPAARPALPPADATLVGAAPGAASVADGVLLPTVSWSLPGEWLLRDGAAPDEPTQALPGPWRALAPLPEKDTFLGWYRYRDVELVGVGGMGRVYRAVQVKTGRPVALKFLLEGRRRGRELWEAELQGRVRHPGVLPVLESGRLAGLPWFAMPYVDGESLKAARPRLGLRQALALMAEVARTVEAIHRRGIVHCDLNPRNVLVAPGGDDATGGLRAYVIDFGISQEQRAPWPADTSRVVGTPAYMAPEQALGHLSDLDPRTDVFALGATLYEMASGRRPFSAETCEAVLTKAIQEEPPSLRELDPALPRRLEHIVLRCLEKDPQDRYPTAGSLADALDAFLAAS
jgi:serine/threonine-protein kinase